VYEPGTVFENQGDGHDYKIQFLVNTLGQFSDKSGLFKFGILYFEHAFFINNKEEEQGSSDERDVLKTLGFRLHKCGNCYESMNGNIDRMFTFI